MPAEELTQVRMGHIIQDRHSNLDDHDQEAVRQRAVALLNVTQQAKAAIAQGTLIAGGSDIASIDEEIESKPNTALIDGVRQFAMNVRELDIDLIDSINPFNEAYAVMAKTMSEERLKQVAAAIAGKRIALTYEEARSLASRAGKFQAERGRLPSITSADAWEKRMAEGIEYLKQRVAKGKNNDTYKRAIFKFS